MAIEQCSDKTLSRGLVPLIRPFGKLLIANRGEIACRIIRTARRLGLGTVAVYSEADRDALHVELADEAYPIGPPPARESYLVADKLIAAARAMGAEAVHPGYGFLSENDAFADACAGAGLVFVGPSGNSIRAMGSKAAAKMLMAASGVPLVPGYHDAAQDYATLAASAARVGYPVLIKASAGGGGKGMRVVTKPAELAAAVAAAKAEARAAFGDDQVLIEKYLEKPRHIEVQIFGDTQGNVVSLFERECTLQRRHQKVVEEAPSAAVSPERRQALMAAARAAAKAVNYTGAGTVEFIADDHGFYFIEMNTRLQVEHPVTEMITGLDLVEWQLRVAMGEALPLRQEAIDARGHAIEVRIYAEDAERGFLPSIGTIARWRQPAGDAGVRVDTGFRQGAVVSPHYDPMLAKLIVWDERRETALAKMARALEDVEIAGVATNVGFLQTLIRHPAVRANMVDTGFIERELATLTHPDCTPTVLELATAAAAVLDRFAAECPHGTVDPHSPWNGQSGWMMVGERRRTMVFRDSTSAEYSIILRQSPRGLKLEHGETLIDLDSRANAANGTDIFLDGVKSSTSAAWIGSDLAITTPNGRFRFTCIDPFDAQDDAADDAGHLMAPMPGTVSRIFAEIDTVLDRGEPVLAIEAMKMEHVLRAPAKGRVTKLRCAEGDFVQDGYDLVDFDVIEVDA